MEPTPSRLVSLTRSQRVGYAPKKKGAVLTLNLEIQKAFMWERIQCMVQAKRLSSTEGFDLWNLRGFVCSANKLIPEVIRRIQETKARYSLMIVDPIYKVMAGRDENAAGDLIEMANLLEKIAVETGAAIVFGHHFTKGNAAGKQFIDRASGSGVFARDPDSIVMMTPHVEEGAFTVECTLRNLPPLEPFVVRREHPLMVTDGDLDPADLKQAGSQKVDKTVDDGLEAMPTPGAIHEDALKRSVGCKTKKAEGLILEALAQNKLHEFLFQKLKYCVRGPSQGPLSREEKEELV